MKRLRWWWYDVTDYRFAQWFHTRVTCRIVGHDPMQKMSGTVCNRCQHFEGR